MAVQCAMRIEKKDQFKHLLWNLQDMWSLSQKFSKDLDGRKVTNEKVVPWMTKIYDILRKEREIYVFSEPILPYSLHEDIQIIPYVQRIFSKMPKTLRLGSIPTGAHVILVYWYNDFTDHHLKLINGTKLLKERLLKRLGYQVVYLSHLDMNCGDNLLEWRVKNQISLISKLK